jgi:hypothetical protein
MMAMQDGLLSIEDYVQGSRAKLRLLFSETRYRVLRVLVAPLLPFLVGWFTHEDGIDQDVAIKQFSSLARVLEGLSPPPWLSSRTLPNMRYAPQMWASAALMDRVGSYSTILQELPEDAYFGLALVIGVAFEQTPRAKREFDGFIAHLGPLGAYLVRRSDIRGAFPFHRFPFLKSDAS